MRLVQFVNSLPHCTLISYFHATMNKFAPLFSLTASISSSPPPVTKGHARGTSGHSSHVTKGAIDPANVTKQVEWLEINVTVIVWSDRTIRCEVEWSGCWAARWEVGWERLVFGCRNNHMASRRGGRKGEEEERDKLVHNDMKRGNSHTWWQGIEGDEVASATRGQRVVSEVGAGERGEAGRRRRVNMAASMVARLRWVVW
jgi:hypothetical protein